MFKLDMGENSLTKISGLSEMRIKLIGILNLWYNNITSLPKHIFQKISAYKINLAFNKIKETEDYACTGSTILRNLFLDSKGLVSVSKKAFKGVQFIHTLSLSSNKIKFLRAGIFANLQTNGYFFLVTIYRRLKILGKA